MPARRALFFLLALTGVMPARGAQPAAPAERGRAIYENGTDGEGRPVAAWAGAGRTPLPAAFVACANCHAADGRGKSEGGVTAPDIRWDTLDKPYGATRPDGRRRPAYAETTLGAAITQGLDSAGQGLDPAMPRYALSAGQAADVAAYLKEIGQGLVPGVSDDVIRLGLLVPEGERAKERADLAARVMRAWADGVNRAGGVYRRRLEVAVFAGPPGEAEAAGVFAVMAGDDSAAAGEAGIALARRGVPVLVAGRAVGTVEERRLFALYPGVIGEARALVRHAVAQRGGEATRVAIVDRRAALEKAGRVVPHAPVDAKRTSQARRVGDNPPHLREALSPPPETGSLAAIAAAVSSLPQVEAEPIVGISADGDSAVRELIVDRPDAVLWLGGAAAMEKFATAAAAQGWRPTMLLAAAQGGAPSPAANWITRATLPRDVLPAALASHRDFAHRHDVPERELAFQFALLASARLFAEAFDNAGRELNREKFVRALEALTEIRTGFTPPLGFSSRRHVAVGGVYVVPAGAAEGSEVGEWIRTD